MERKNMFFSVLASVLMIGYLLFVAKNLLIPLIVAVFIWNLLNTLSQTLQQIPRVGSSLPHWLAMCLSFLIFALLLKLLISIMSDNVNEVIHASARYEANLLQWAHTFEQHTSIKILSKLNGFIKELNFQTMLMNVSAMFTSLASSALLIVLYVAFLFIEQHFFRIKLDKILPKAANRRLADSIISRITQDVQTYLGLKTVMSLMIALASWVIMKWIGLDFAEFWALLIFFLNYIPNIGAIVAIAFPALLALIQFQDWLMFLIIAVGLILVQFVIGSVVEPRFMGRSLNLSPLVILFTLGLWGAIWGILGMILAIPITVIVMIVCAHFESSRPLAILLSRDGCIERFYEEV